MDDEIRVREIWPPGTIIKGDYVIERKLGVGGFGAVYIANHRFLGSKHVIKRLHEQFASDQEYVRKFVNEGRAVRRLKSCPHVVEVEHMTQSEDGHLILVMEYVGGGDLDALIQSRPIAITEVIDFGRQIALGLQAAHEAKLIHRDIKPQNILIGQDAAGRPVLKLIDFGLVKDHASTGQTSVLRSGTLGYAAPEQWMRAGKEIDGRTDLYSLGATMYRMLCGRMPYENVDDVMPWMAQAMLTPPPPPHTLRPECPQALSALVLQLLAPEPSGRPAAASAVVASLEAMTGAAPAPAPRVPSPPPPDKQKEWSLVSGAKPKKSTWSLVAKTAAAFAFAIFGWMALRPGVPSPDAAKSQPEPPPVQTSPEMAKKAVDPPESPQKPPPQPVTLNPAHVDPAKPENLSVNHIALGDAARDKGDLATALTHYRQAGDNRRLEALQRTVEGDTEERASAFMDRGQFDEALKLTDRWLPEFKQSQRLQRLRARIIRARDSQ